ncbi:hypothetical protein Q73_00610 [Bacillus coahuilensis m2-6]|uniref:hypothetical protein n=1 Tax=Bacillus coahuilensis TaxID=408580 RepID=UPI000493DB59|nr:hypothetical protein [Bacillus coahuilensis]KUP09912.1 hypothetical protein Q73_00610 [Bacillus coahuilensis m2-6]
MEYDVYEKLLEILQSNNRYDFEKLHYMLKLFSNMDSIFDEHPKLEAIYHEIHTYYKDDEYPLPVIMATVEHILKGELH